MKTTLLAVSALALLAGCDALVGGECAPGYTWNGESCTQPRLGGTLDPGTDGTTSSSGSAGGDPTGSGGEGGSSGTIATGSGGEGGTSGSGTPGVGGAGGAGGPGSGGAPASGPGGGTSSSSSSASTGTVFFCFPPLARCESECVNLAFDTQNCGACGFACDTGETCDDGTCSGSVKQYGGHSVVIGLDYRNVSLGDPEAALLGNAVFLAAHDPVRVLEYVDATTESPEAVEKVEELVFFESIIAGRTVETVVATTADAVPQALASKTFDVLLVHDQSRAGAGRLSGMGSSWAQSIGSFTVGGGVVVVLATTAGKNQMKAFLSSSGVLPVSAMTNVAGQTLTKTAQTHPVSNNLVDAFPAHKFTASFTVGTVPGASVLVVDEDAAPVVLHRGYE